MALRRPRVRTQQQDREHPLHGDYRAGHGERQQRRPELVHLESAARQPAGWSSEPPMTSVTRASTSSRQALASPGTTDPRLTAHARRLSGAAVSVASSSLARMSIAIRAEGLIKTFKGKGKSPDVEAVRGVDLEVSSR